MLLLGGGEGVVLPLLWLMGGMTETGGSTHLLELLLTADLFADVGKTVLEGVELAVFGGGFGIGTETRWDASTAACCSHRRLARRSTRGVTDRPVGDLASRQAGRITAGSARRYF